MNAVMDDTNTDATVEMRVGANSQPLPAELLADTKLAYTLRRIRETDAQRLLGAPAIPAAGDIVLARVARLGQHPGLQLRSGRRATLFEGDLVMVAYGNRYASDQFEGIVPGDLGDCDLIAGGGVAARMTNAHKRMRSPTRLAPLGLVANASGQRLNLRDYALPATTTAPASLPVITVVGASMNAGKTTTASHLIRGFRRAGLRVGAAKLTGTGSGGDILLMRDAGAAVALDFTDAGLASTYRCAIPELIRSSQLLIDHLGSQALDVAVIEIADGLLQRETDALLGDATLAPRLGGILYASGDALSAIAGLQWLRQRNLPVLALTGALTSAPLSVRETTAIADVPVLGLDALASADAAGSLLRAASATASAPDAAANVAGTEHRHRGQA